MNTMNPVLPVVDPDTAFPQVEKMIYDLCWKFSGTYPITFEECKSEAYYAFVKSCYDFKPERKMKFSTWCYYWVWCKLKDLVTFRSKDPMCFVEMNDDHVSLFGEAPPQRSESLEMIDDLSDDAKEIINLLIETPAEILGGASIPAKQLLVRVKRYLEEHAGRSRKDLDKAHREIELRFREQWALN